MIRLTGGGKGARLQVAQYPPLILLLSRISVEFPQSRIASIKHGNIFYSFVQISFVAVDG